MAIYNLDIFALGDATVTPDPNITTYNITGEQWDWAWNSAPTLTISTGATPQSVEINDTDLNPEGFSDENSDSGSYDYTSQVLTSALNINGNTYQAGLRLQNEYEVTLIDGAGNVYTLVAVSVEIPRNGGTDYSGGYDPQFIGFTWDGATPPAGVTLTATGEYQDNATMAAVVCFAEGTMIRVEDGEKPIETLRVGDRVWTPKNGCQPLRWIGSRRLDGIDLQSQPHLRPIRIRAGALSNNRPAQDLLVSPQHRMLIRSRIAQRMFGTDEVLVAAKQLLQIDGIEIAEDVSEVTYFHMLFDGHEVVLANGAKAESLFTGPEALKAVGNAARREILALFPELREQPTPVSARKLVEGRRARQLALRHSQNRKPLFS